MSATTNSETTYLLRTCAADGTSHGGFRWPESGPVKCLDWDSMPVCGHGLHGLLLGQGDPSVLDWGPAALWQVVRVYADEVVAIDDGEKVKVPRGVVVFSGDRAGALATLRRLAPKCGVLPGEMVAVGNYRMATAGYSGTATAGRYGTATAGFCGMARTGDYGAAAAGYGGRATAGFCGMATAGDRGTATVGVGGTARAGYGGTARAGYGGILSLRRWDG